VKVDGLFFGNKPASETRWTMKTWIYGLRANMHSMLKADSLRREDLEESVTCFKPDDRRGRRPARNEEAGKIRTSTGSLPTGPDGRRRAHDCFKEPITRNMACLGIFSPKDGSPAESDGLEAALEQFREIPGGISGVPADMRSG